MKNEFNKLVKKVNDLYDQFAESVHVHGIDAKEIGKRLDEAVNELAEKYGYGVGYAGKLYKIQKSF